MRNFSIKSPHRFNTPVERCDRPNKNVFANQPGFSDAKQILRKRLFNFAVYLTVGLSQLPASGSVRGLQSTEPGSAFTPAWRSLSMGAGGLLTGMDYHSSDGTLLVRNDTYGGYLYKANGVCTWGGASYSAPCWQQLFTVSSIPANEANVVTSGNGNMGTVELVACDSNTNVLYALWNGALHISTNRGLTWALTTLRSSQNANSGPKDHGKFIACDPHNPDVAYIATPGGLYYTTNGTSGSGATFAQVRDIGTTGRVPNVIVYDPNSSVLGGKSQHFWTFTFGSGVYETTNGGPSAGGSFNLTSNGPTTFFQMKCDKFSQLWVTNDNQTLNRYVNGAGWTSITSLSGTGSNGAVTIAFDPASKSSNSNLIVVAWQDGNLLVSSNNGTSWRPPIINWNETFSATGTQPGWLGHAAQYDRSGVQFDDTLDLLFDSFSNIWAAAGISVWTMFAPVSGNPTVWTANAVGIEQLVVNQIISPPAISPLAGVWDRGIFKLSNPDVFPAVQYPNSTRINQIQGAWGIDYASASIGFVTGLVTSNLDDTLAPATSTDGGRTWSAWANNPSEIGNGGVIAASTSSNWVAVSKAVRGTLQYTNNGARSAWSSSSISGCTAPFLTSLFNNRQPLAADRVTPNEFYIVDTSRNVCRSNDGGQNFTLAARASFDGAIYRDVLKTAPGQAGHLFYTSGYAAGQSKHPQNTHLYKSTNQGTNWAKVNLNLQEVIAFGFGAPKPGGSGYPTIYAFGWLSRVQGYYQSTDGGSTWSAINVPTAIRTWAKDSVDLVTDISGDQSVYGRIYVGFLGSGAAYIDTQDACPWVNFSNISPSASLSGTVMLGAEHSGLVPVTSVQFQVDGTNIGAAQTGAGPYSTSWDTGQVAPGAHTLSVITTGNGCSGKGSTFSIPITTR